MKIKKFTRIDWHKLKDQPANLPITDRFYRTPEDITFMFTGYWKQNGKNRTGEFTLFLGKGFLNDAQSSPIFLWWHMRPDGLARAASLSHDPLYRSKGLLLIISTGCTLTVEFPFNVREPVILTRKASDQIYRACYQAWAQTKRDHRKVKQGYAMLRMWGWMRFGKPIRISKHLRSIIKE